jgi:hypothetical protein
MNFLTNLPKDKLLHYLVGTYLGLFGLIDPYLGLAVVVIFAVGKEVYDSLGYGTSDVYDALVTIAGGVFTLLIILT